MGKRKKNLLVAPDKYWKLHYVLVSMLFCVPWKGGRTVTEFIGNTNQDPCTMVKWCSV